MLALVAFRLWFSAALPMTGDEAYFVYWGEHPAGGYYDHPPMVGWWLSALLAISRAEWVLRLPALVLPLILAGGAWWLVRPHGAARARLAALLVLLQPVNVWNVLITTDTPVILFSMLSILANVAALRNAPRTRRALLWHGAAGVLLGLAFLGKYFAALLGIAYLAHVIFIRRSDEVASHRGQVAFPGGRVDPVDHTLVDTALREAHEEVGLHPTLVEVIGAFPVMNTMASGISVAPFVGVMSPEAKLEADRREVAEIFDVPLSALRDQQYRGDYEWSVNGRNSKFPAILYGGQTIWGLTLRITMNLLDILDGKSLDSNVR